MTATVPIKLAQHLAYLAMEQWVNPQCELRDARIPDRCQGPAIGFRWEDGFADMVCVKHAEDAVQRGAIVVLAKRHDGTEDHV